MQCLFAVLAISCLAFLAHPVVGCDGYPATGTIDDFTITFHINCDAETVTVTLQYDAYSSNWWGVLFGTTMFDAESLIYTTGTSFGDEVFTAVAEGLWPYHLGLESRQQSDFVLKSQWTEVSTVEDGSSITVSYQTDLANTEWTTSTETVSVRFAEGMTSDGLTVKSYHQHRTDTLTLDLRKPTTKTPSSSPTMEPTPAVDGYELCVEKGGFGFGDLEIFRNSKTEMMKIKIAGPLAAWYGVGFGSNKMVGTYSLIGSGDEFAVSEMTLGKHKAGTLLSASGNTSVLEDGDFRMMILERKYAVEGTYDFTEFMDCSNEYIPVIAAYGSSNTYKWHGFSRKTSSEAHNNCCGPDTRGQAANRGWGGVSVFVSCAVLMWMW